MHKDTFLAMNNPHSPTSCHTPASCHSPTSCNEQNHQERLVDASHNWVYRFLPQRVWPYAQLARWDRPIGWKLLLWPCWWSSTLAFSYSLLLSPISANLLYERFISLFWHLTLFLLGAILMRGAGCTYNDLIDRNIDKLVKRTCLRPLPAGHIRPLHAFYFMSLQLLFSFLILIQFNSYTILVGLSSLICVALYPFMKRILSYPQLFLGLAFSWGALVGWTAETATLQMPALLLYAANLLWTIGYDTIYAMQDKEDDFLIGIGSTALLFGQKATLAIFVLYSLMILFIMSAFYLTNLPFIAFIGLFFAAILLFYQAAILDKNNSELCLKLFKLNHWVGMIVFLSIVLSIGYSLFFP